MTDISKERCEGVTKWLRNPLDGGIEYFGGPTSRIIVADAADLIDALRARVEALEGEQHAESALTKARARIAELEQMINARYGGMG